MKQGHRTWIWVVALLASMFVATFAHAQPKPIADAFAHHRSVLACPGADSAHDYEACAFEFMRRVACDNQSLVALWPKSGGTFCTHAGRGYDCDKLVVRATGDMFDVVSSAGAAHQSPSWNHVASGVFSGTVPPPSCDAPPPPPPSPATVSLEEATEVLDAAFQARTHRPWVDVERAAILGALRSSGWDGGPRVPVSAVQALSALIGRYSGNIADPFPVLDAAAAAERVLAYFRAQRGRDIQSTETTALVGYAFSLGYAGGATIQLWIVERLEAAINAYRDELYVAPPPPPRPVDPLARPATAGAAFSVDDEPFEWRGITAFLLFYDYIHRPAQYQAFVAAAEAAKVTVPRLSISTSTEYLTLRPRSGGTYGQGWTTPLYPGSVPDFWPRLRSMIADLNSRGWVPEIVPFLTVGPLDASVPQMRTAQTRLAYLQEAARELLPVRAAFVEIANEYNHIGFLYDGLEIEQMRAAYKAIDPDRLVAPSAPPSAGVCGPCALMANGDYITVHADRSTSPRSYTWIIRQLGLSQLATGKHTVNDEGINADTVGEFGNDPSPENHWANGALMRLVPGLSYTFHFDRALKGLAPATHDGSKQAIDAWRDGTDAVPAGLQGQYFAYTNILGAAAAVARLGETEGWLLLLGATVTPAVPEWTVALVGARGPHRLYHMTRVVVH